MFFWVVDFAHSSRPSIIIVGVCRPFGCLWERVDNEGLQLDVHRFRWECGVVCQCVVYEQTQARKLYSGLICKCGEESASIASTLCISSSEEEAASVVGPIEFAQKLGNWLCYGWFPSSRRAVQLNNTKIRRGIRNPILDAFNGLFSRPRLTLARRKSLSRVKHCFRWDVLTESMYS